MGLSCKPCGKDKSFIVKSLAKDGKEDKAVKKNKKTASK